MIRRIKIQLLDESWVEVDADVTRVGRVALVANEGNWALVEVATGLCLGAEPSRAAAVRARRELERPDLVPKSGSPEGSDPDGAAT